MTWYSAVPTLHQLLLARVEPGAARPAGADKLRFIRSCSASLPPQVMHDLEAAFGAPVLEAYGMTEAAHQMASNPLPPGERRAGSVGRGTDVRISIMDGKGRHLAAGERGEVCIRARTSRAATRTIPKPTPPSFFGGWFRTGDQGILDANGYLTLVGRLKELINRGGEKISPREIDEVLLTHPAVAEAVCFGVPHPTWGEEVAAAVVLKPDAGRQRAPPTCWRFCKERRSRTSSARSRFTSRRRFRARRPARFSAASWPRRSRRNAVKIVIAGAGAIGGYIGARLARAGADVVLFARGPHLQAMQERGLRVHQCRRRLRGPAAGHRRSRDRSVRPTSCFSASRRTRSRRSRRTLPPLFGPDTVVVSTQNGIPWWYFQSHGGELDGLRLERIDPGGVIAAAIEPRRVVGSLAYFATDIVEPGVIRHTEGNRISFGEPDGTRSERARRIAEALIAAGFRCPVTTRFRHEIWVKLLGNVAFNPISALTGGTLEEMVRHPDTSPLVRDVMTETEAVAGKLGIELPISIDQRMAGAEKVGAHKTSMLQDLEAGRPMEIEADRRRRRRAGRTAGRADAGDARGVRLREAAGRTPRRTVTSGSPSPRMGSVRRTGMTCTNRWFPLGAARSSASSA